jgi:hypothetical protein
MVGVDLTTIYSRQLSYEMQRWHHTSCLTSLTYLNSMSNVLYILRTNFPIFPGSNVDGIIQYLPCVRGTRAKTLFCSLLYHVLCLIIVSFCLIFYYVLCLIIVSFCLIFVTMCCVWLLFHFVSFLFVMYLSLLIYDLFFLLSRQTWMPNDKSNRPLQ